MAEFKSSDKRGTAKCVVRLRGRMDSISAKRRVVGPRVEGSRVSRSKRECYKRSRGVSRRHSFGSRRCSFTYFVHSRKGLAMRFRRLRAGWRGALMRIRRVRKPYGLRYRYRYRKMRKRVPRALRYFNLFARNNRLNKFVRARVLARRAYKFYLAFGRSFRLRRLLLRARNVYGLMDRLETRLVVVLLRLGFFSNLRGAVFYIKRRGVFVNRRLVKTPACTLRHGDIVEARPSIRRRKLFRKWRLLRWMARRRVALAVERYCRYFVYKRVKHRLGVRLRRDDRRRGAWSQKRVKRCVKRFRGRRFVCASGPFLSLLYTLASCMAFVAVLHTVVDHKVIAQPHSLATERVFKRHLKSLARLSSRLAGTRYRGRRLRTRASATRLSGSRGRRDMRETRSIRESRRSRKGRLERRHYYPYHKERLALRRFFLVHFREPRRTLMLKRLRRIPRPRIHVRRPRHFRGGRRFRTRRRHYRVHRYLHGRPSVFHRDKRAGLYVYIRRGPVGFRSHGRRPPVFGYRLVNLLWQGRVHSF